MYQLLKQIAITGIKTEAPPQPDETLRALAQRLQERVLATFEGALTIRHVDAGSCNGCEIEISGAFGPVYDAERFGARLVASPRHADALLVTGVVTHNMAQPLRNTVEATPKPRVVIACGDCALNRGVFADAYGVLGAVGEVAPVDVEVPGCPPTPEQIVAALRSVTGR